MMNSPVRRAGWLSFCAFVFLYAVTPGALPAQDGDLDGILDDVDNCPHVPNTGETDGDGDGFGNACECGQTAAVFRAAGSRVRSASLGDVNGDGVVDLAFAEPSCQNCAGACPRPRGRVRVASGRTVALLYEIEAPEECDEFGTAIADAGDVDSDGISDLLVGAEGGAGGRGRAYVFSGATGERIFPMKPLTGRSVGSRYGAAVVGVGDFNRDGFADFAVAAPGEKVDATSRGRVFLYRGGPSRTIAEERSFEARDPGEAFGTALAARMDFDGDGALDLAVGAPPLGPGPLGHAYVLSLPGGALLFDAEGPLTAAAFGASIALIGDTNGDARPELLVGAPGAPRSAQAGEVHLFTGGKAGAGGKGAPKRIGVVRGSPADALGWSLTDLGDLDGDTRADFAVGAPGDGEGRGRVQIVSGRTQTALADLRGSSAGSSFGNDVVAAGDVDQDGVQDLTIGSKDTGARAALYLMGDQNGNGLRDACESCSSATSLEMGRETAFEICPLTPERCFVVEGTPGRSWRVTLASDDDEFRATLKLRWGAPPTGTSVDATGVLEASKDSVRTLLTSVEEGPAYLTVEMFGIGACAEGLRLLVDEFSGPAVDSVTPRFVGAGRPIDVAITGLGLKESYHYSLLQTPGGSEFEGTVTLASNDLAEVLFDLTAAPIGGYDLVVKSADVQVARLQEAFQVRAFHESDLLVSLRGAPFFRRTDPKGQVTLSYINTGDDVLIAPILRVRPVGAGPATQVRFLGLPRERNEPELQILGVHSNGLPHLIPPGAEEEVSIVFNAGAVCDLCPLRFEVQIFTPDARDYINWSLFPNPDPANVDDELWETVRAPLSVNLGKTWGEYQDAFGERARRLRHRGDDVRSVAGLFEFAFKEAMGQPHSAIVGTVHLSGGNTPVEGTSVAAFVRDEMRALTRTRSDGSFVLTGLRALTAHRLEVSGHTVVGPGGLVTTPPESYSEQGSGDLLGVELEVTPGGDLLPAPVESPVSGLPEKPPLPPESMFSTVAVWEFLVIASRDPNKKTDCVLPGDALLADDDEDEDEDGGEGNAPTAQAAPVIDYTIFFENSRCATASTQHVRIVDTLDADMFDITSIQLTDISVGEDSVDKLIFLDEPIWDVWNVTRTLEDVRVVRLSPTRDRGPECDDGALPECDGTEDDADGAGAGGVDIVTIPRVTVDTRLEEVTGENKYLLTWTISSNSFGFLPPNDCATHQGEGFVSFRIEPAPGMETAQLENNVEVLFDGDQSRALSLSVTTDLMPTEAPVTPEYPLPVDNPAGDADLLVVADQSLSWDPVLADHYRLSVWRVDAGARIPVFEDRVVTRSSYSHDTDWELAMTYEWEVVSVNAIGESAPTTWTFVTAAAPAEPPGFVALNDPADASDVGTDFVLEWDEAPGASTYSVYVWDSSGPRGRPVAHVGSLTGYELADLEANTTYSWQVVAANEGGESESPVWTFTTGTTTFLRGDVDANGLADITDAIALLNHLFQGDAAPTCQQAADMDDSGFLIITDAIVLLNFLFSGSSVIAPPTESCGFDTTPDELTCEAFAPCP